MKKFFVYSLIVVVLIFLTGVVFYNYYPDDIEQSLKESCLEESGNVAVCPSSINLRDDREKIFFIKLFNPTDETMVINSISEFDSGDILKIEKIAVRKDCEIELNISNMNLESKEQNVLTGFLRAGKDCKSGEEFIGTVFYKPVLGGEIFREQFTIEIR